MGALNLGPPHLRMCVRCGSLLVASGLGFALVWALTGGPWEGPVTFRKPILFGLSTGVTLWSLAWVAAWMPERPEDGWMMRLTAAALVVEVALIDLQFVRGVPSHFNRLSALDGAITDVMSGLVLFTTAAIAVLSIRALGPMHLDPDYKAAARFGMFLLLLGCVLGLAVTLVGEAMLAEGRAPERYGERGVLKFPHGLPLHAIQILPVLVWVLKRCSVPLPRRVAAVRWLAFALVMATGYAVVQTGSGQGRFEPGGIGLVMLMLTGVALAGAGFAVGWPQARRSRPG